MWACTSAAKCNQNEHQAGLEAWPGQCALAVRCGYGSQAVTFSCLIVQVLGIATAACWVRARGRASQPVCCIRSALLLFNQTDSV